MRSEDVAIELAIVEIETRDSGVRAECEDADSKALRNHATAGFD
jgi:hypothetical protein